MGLAEPCGSRCISIGQDKPWWVPDGDAGMSGPREHPGSTPCWGPRGDGAGGPVHWMAPAAVPCAALTSCANRRKNITKAWRDAGPPPVMLCSRPAPQTLLCLPMRSPAEPAHPPGSNMGWSLTQIMVKPLVEPNPTQPMLISITSVTSSASHFQFPSAPPAQGCTREIPQAGPKGNEFIFH